MDGMGTLLLNAYKRMPFEKLHMLRKQYFLPGVVYGKEFESLAIKIPYFDFLKIYQKAKKNHVILLQVDGKKVDVFIHDFQIDPVKGNFLHVDFLKVERWSKIHVEIPLVFVWQPPVKEKGAIIEEHLTSLHVRCYLEDLVEYFEVDMSRLIHPGDFLKIADIAIPKEIEVLHDLQEIVVYAHKVHGEEESQ